MNLTPYKHQQALIDLNPDRWGLWWGTQVGKTLTSIWLSNQKGYPFIVITKKGLKKQWELNLKQYATQDWFLLSKEEFKSRYQSIPKYETVIWDEAHLCAGEYKRGKKGNKNITISGSFHEWIKKHNPKFRYLLTATPYSSNPWNIYRLAEHLGHKWKYSDFRDVYFTSRKQRYRRCPKGRCWGCKLCTIEVWDTKQDDATKRRLRDTTTKLGSVVRMSECTDMPRERQIDEPMKMTPEQKRLIDDMVCGNWMSEDVYKHRIECGHVSGEGYEPDRFIDSPINDRVVELASEYRKVVIVCHFRLHIEHLKSLFPDRKVIVFWGDMGDFHSANMEAEKSEDCIVIAQSACSAGYSLKSFEAMVFASCGYSWVDYEQMMGRVRNIERKTPYIYYFLTCGQIGDRVLKNVRSQKDFCPQ